MRAREFKYSALVFAFQLMLVLLADTVQKGSLDWLVGVCVIWSFLLPFIGYIASLYNAPIFAATSTIPKMVCLTLLSFAMTMAGAVLILMLLLAFLGPNHR